MPPFAAPLRPFLLALTAAMLLGATSGTAAAGAPDALAASAVLYDRVLPLARLEQLDGSPGSPVVDLARFRQGLDEWRRASLVTPVQADWAALASAARAAKRDGVVALAFLDLAFERVRPGAIESGALRMEGGRPAAVSADALAPARAFAAAALTPRTYHGAGVTFCADAAGFVSSDGPPARLEVDFGDGSGWRVLAMGERVRVSYGRVGPRVLSARVTRADGTVAYSRAAFDVAALVTPAPDDTLAITASVPYLGQFGTGRAFVYLAPGHTSIMNPVVAVEGFDTDNSMDWEELYALLAQENLIETLRADGFDSIVLDFADATDAIQKNAFVVAELVQQVRAAAPPGATLAMVGASMGGLCSRYALAWMESQGMTHGVRTWISFDSPQAGADIPLGLQYWIDFFASQSTSAADFRAVLQRPAARQMLLYHFTTPAGTTGQADPLRPALLADFAAAGDWPALPRRVAIANGSSQRATQGFAPGSQLIQYSYSSLLTSITGNVWAVPDGASTRVFQGSLRILFSTTSQNVTVSGTLPWDGAPGGYRPSMTELDTTAAPYGDIVALHPAHCFIPVVSALAIPTNDPFFDVAGTPNLAALTPFDAVYVPAANQEHVLITPESATWVRNEIWQGVLGVPEDEQPARANLSAAAPNPSRGEVALSFTLSRDGRADLRVYDVSGREVAVLASGPRSAGLHEARWDGRDARGDAAPGGVYFARLVTSAGSVTRRVLRLP
ncbi:MAG: T9SS type A sorting domain-containing protein [Candidatus Eisenbacteria bacterium]|nr:T9SS type A sorting domain-containing protein [Candidatus Eisenbacteria bacterium]